jgi:uncharacterized membrane protein YfcA
MLFNVVLFLAAVLSGATASIAGFGIGSVLTPLVALRVATPIAVAAVALPHALATALRCWRLRRAIEWNVLRDFGVLSAAGGFAGALLNASVSSRTLTLVLGLLLIATSVAALTQWTARWQPRGPMIWLFGLASGFFGGIAGNQGGLRAAALLSWSLPPAAFVATATATGLLVDVARTPIYLWRFGSEIRELAVTIAIASAGVVIGTFLGERVMLGLSRDQFRRIVAGLIGVLGVWLVFRALSLSS